MILVELALQGIEGFPAQLRIPLRRGLNVASAVAPLQRRSVVDALYHCIYPDGARAEATAHLAAAQATESRIALTFYGRDKVTYRLIREVVSGAMKLYRYAPESKKYRLFTSSVAEVAQYIRVQQQLPDEVSFERLFIYGPQDGSTRSGAARVTETAAPSGPGLPQARFMSGAMARPGSTMGRPTEGPGAGFNPNNALVLAEMAAEAAPAKVQPKTAADKKALLLRLRVDLEAVMRAGRAQEEIDQLGARRFEISERLEAQDRFEARCAQLIEAKSEDHSLDNMPPNLSERLEAFEGREERFFAEEAKLQDAMERIAQEAEQDMVLPLQQDRYFQISILAAVSFVAIAVLISRPLVAVLNIPAALVAVGAAFRYISDRERAGLRQVKVKAIEDRIERLHKQRDLDTGVTRRMMEKLDIDSVSSLLEKVQEYEARDQEIETTQATLRDLSTDTQQDNLELRQVEGRIAALESEVAAAAGVQQSTDALQREVTALEADLGADVPPRMKSPPLGLPTMSATGVRKSDVSLASLTGDLVAQSAFSSHVSAASPLATGEFTHARKTSELLTQTSSGVFPAPVVRGRADSLTASTSDLLATTADLRPSTADLVMPGSGPFDPTHIGASRVPHVSIDQSAPGQPPAFASSASGSGTLPPSASGLGTLPPPAILASGPGMPRAPSGPVVPAPVVSPPKSNPVFDFGGGFIGEGDNEEGYESGYGTKDSSSGEDDEGGASTAGYVAMGSGASGFGGGVGSYGDGGPLPPDRSRELVQSAVDQLSMSVDDLGNRLKPRLAQFLDAFTSHQFKAAELGAQGEVSVVSADDETVSYTDLEGEALDKVDMALRLALAELVVSKFRVPIIIDDPVIEFDPKRRKLFGQMLGHFGRATQVLVLSGQSDLPGSPVHLDGSTTRPQ